MKCFYHNDLDGRCAASVAAQYEFMKSDYYDEPNKSDYIEVNYANSYPNYRVIKDNELVYILDYSFTDSTINQIRSILNKTKNIIWIDHHTSSLNLMKNNKDIRIIPGVRLDSLSASALTYKYLYDEEYIPKYIKMVSDYDTWNFKYGDEVTYFKLGMDCKSYDALDDIWDELKYDSLNTEYPYLSSEILDRGKVIFDYNEKFNKEYLNDYSYESFIDGYKCLVVNKRSNSWIFGDKINDYPLVVVFVFDGENYIYSLFSANDKVDCSKISENYGGGGHKGAAGFISDKLLFRKE